MNQTGSSFVFFVDGHPLVLQYEITEKVSYKRVHFLPFLGRRTLDVAIPPLNLISIFRGSLVWKNLAVIAEWQKDNVGYAVVRYGIKASGEDVSSKGFSSLRPAHGCAVMGKGIDPGIAEQPIGNQIPSGLVCIPNYTTGSDALYLPKAPVMACTAAPTLNVPVFMTRS